ncbi:MAG: hypothetical protein ACTSPX_01175 [Candidatus Thorarchaeota archaeon]
MNRLNKIVYREGRLPGGRYPYLVLFREDQEEWMRFYGEDVDNWCTIAERQHEGLDKWNWTTYRLVLAPKVRGVWMLDPQHSIQMLDPRRGTWGDKCRSWEEIDRAANELSIPATFLRTIIQDLYPRVAARFDNLKGSTA